MSAEHSSEEGGEGLLTDAEWRAFQQIPDQGYSHRGWIDARIADRLAAVRAERGEWKFRCEQHERRRAEVERVLDDALGTEEDDGAGEGLVADVALLASRATSAEAERDDLRGRLAAVEALRDAYYAWDGDPESEFSSSPRQRAQLDAALANPSAAQGCGPDCDDWPHPGHLAPEADHDDRMKR